MELQLLKENYFKIKNENKTKNLEIGDFLLGELVNNHQELWQYSINFAKQTVRTIEGTSCRILYIFQHEYALVDSSNIDIIGSNDATTCINIVVRENKTSKTLVAHYDGSHPQQLAHLIFDSFDSNAILDIHLVGAFLDEKGTSLKDTKKLLAALTISGPSTQQKIIRTACILEANTTKNDFDPTLENDTKSIIIGIGVNTIDGSIFPANFVDRTPGIMLRRLRCFAYESKYINVFRDNCVIIEPFEFSIEENAHVYSLQNDNFFRYFSSSPRFEPPNFFIDMRENFKLMAKIENCDEAFRLCSTKIKINEPLRPIIYTLNSNNIWIEI
eukprot:TRINITY_DN2286_c0_g1_i1.p1 TRINITY_DN2286_c0_g1~~TRINITY_DN2286_c0_g1_i1.p1  ORF type:complete len:329 (-),score=100.43 TRINITY_DN2286_c0_g1_i1:56-1042(-)